MCAWKREFFLTQVLIVIISLNFLPAALGVITLTPQNDSLVPYNSDAIITYDCETSHIPAFEKLFWDINDQNGKLIAQLSTVNLTELYANRYGIIVENDPNLPNRTRLNFNTTRFCESNFRRDHGSVLVLRCRTFTIIPNLNRAIFVYGPLETPSNLVFSAISETHLNLSWTGTTVPPGVEVVNFIEVTNITSGETETFNTTERYIPFDERGACSPFNLTVRSYNEELDETTDVAFTMQNIPISPNVTPVFENLATVVDLTDQDNITITIMSRPANVCSEQFPVENYTLVVMETSDRLPISLNDDDQLQGEINKKDVPGLAVDQAISYTVEVCSNITCRTTDSSTAYTTGVQMPTIYFIEDSTNVLVTCDFASGSTASGCLFNFEFTMATDDEVQSTSEQYNLPRSSTVESPLCVDSLSCICINGTNHLVPSYSTIEAYTLEEAGVTRSSISVPVLRRDVTETPEMIAVCSPTVPPSNSLGTGEIIAIAVGVGGFIVLLVLIVLLVCCVGGCARRNRNLQQKQNGIELQEPVVLETELSQPEGESSPELNDGIQAELTLNVRLYRRKNAEEVSVLRIVCPKDEINRKTQPFLQRKN